MKLSVCSPCKKPIVLFPLLQTLHITFQLQCTAYAVCLLDNNKTIIVLLFIVCLMDTINQHYEQTGHTHTQIIVLV